MLKACFSLLVLAGVAASLVVPATPASALPSVHPATSKMVNQMYRRHHRHHRRHHHRYGRYGR